MRKSTTIMLDPYFDQWIQRMLSEGRYSNADDVVRAALRLLEEEEQKVVALRNAIADGVNSGHALDFDAEAHLKALHGKGL